MKPPLALGPRAAALLSACRPGLAERLGADSRALLELEALLQRWEERFVRRWPPLAVSQSAERLFEWVGEQLPQTLSWEELVALRGDELLLSAACRAGAPQAQLP